jgi:hypothetical protein
MKATLNCVNLFEPELFFEGIERPLGLLHTIPDHILATPVTSRRAVALLC